MFVFGSFLLFSNIYTNSSLIVTLWEEVIQKGSSIHTYLYQWWFLLCQAGGAEKGSSEALWRAAAEAGGPGNRQGREQTDRSGYLKAQLLRPADIRGLVSEHYQLLII